MCIRDSKDYFQQRADYLIHVTLDDNNQILRGKEKVTFYNNSQDALTYIWIQLDQNQMSQQSDSYIIQQHKLENKTSSEKIEKWDNTFDGGYKIEKVFDEKNKNLKYTVNKTMMRIDLPMPLKPGNSFIFQIEYWYNINDRMKLGGRSGFEYFKEDDNYLYTIAQFFPRLCAYNAVSYTHLVFSFFLQDAKVRKLML